MRMGVCYLSFETYFWGVAKILLYGINYSPDLTGIGKYTGEMGAWMAKQGHDVEVITAMPYYPQWKIAEALHAAGADINAQSVPPGHIHMETYYHAWGTPLHWAVAANDLQAVNILLRFGAERGATARSLGGSVGTELVGARVDRHEPDGRLG